MASGAVMIRALLIASAWTMPLPVAPMPVPEVLLLLLPKDEVLPTPLLLPVEVLLLPVEVGAKLLPDVLLPVLPWPVLPASPESTARRVWATLVASAFFRYTTWMLPAAPGWSRLATSWRTALSLEGFSERTSRLLVRGSPITETRWLASPPTPGVPPTLPPPVSLSRRLTVWARSSAEACLRLMTRMSPWGTSMDSMMRAMRPMFSA
jgi:hypothetical protein